MIPGSRLSTRNTQGVCPYCNCQRLKKSHWSNELWKFNTTKIFYANYLHENTWSTVIHPLHSIQHWSQNVYYHIDINECNAANGGCERNCNDTIGSFICSCDTGYQLNENGLNCNGKCLLYKILLTIETFLYYIPRLGSMNIYKVRVCSKVVAWYLVRRKSAWYTLMRFQLIKNGVAHAYDI